MLKKKIICSSDHYLDIYFKIYNDSLPPETEWSDSSLDVDHEFTENLIPTLNIHDYLLTNEISQDCFYEDIDILCKANQIPTNFFDEVDKHLILIYSNNKNLFLGIRARLAEKLAIAKFKDFGFKNIKDLNWLTAKNVLSSDLQHNQHISLRSHILMLNHDLEIITPDGILKYDVKSVWGKNPLTLKLHKHHESLVLIRFDKAEILSINYIGILDSKQLASYIGQNPSQSEIQIPDSHFIFDETFKKLAA